MHFLEKELQMKIVIASDHAGFEQKEELASYLKDRGYNVVDAGPDTDDRVDYPDFAKKVATSVASHEVDYGVLVCGTGVGMAIAANKISGIRAANVTSASFAALSREHNDANIVSVSGRFVSLEENKKILDAFLTTQFSGGRHAGRVQKIADLENRQKEMI